jgi:hypothetical protein
MSIQDTAATTATNTVTSRSIVPFTGGLIIFVYAWFWPEGYGHWVGQIVHAFRQTAGF